MSPCWSLSRRRPISLYGHQFDEDRTLSDEEQLRALVQTWQSEFTTQKLAQTRPGARAALLFYSCLSISGAWSFGPWPDGVPVQIHRMDNDPIFVGDIDAAREIIEKVEDAELFLYPGDQHCFADRSLPSFDADAATLLTRRVLEFLTRV